MVADIGSAVSAFVKEVGAGWAKPPAEWISAIKERKDKNVAKMAETLAKDPAPMNFHSALNVVRDIVKANPEAMLVNEGANALDFTRSIVDMYQPRKRIDVGTWGIMGIGMGYCVAAAVVTKQQVIAIEGDSAFGFSGMEVETICRYDLPVCVVVMNNNGVYKGTDVDPTGRDPAPTVFVKGARYDTHHRGLRRRGRERHDPGGAAQGDRRSDPLAQAHAHQRGDRRDGGHGERAHHVAQPDCRQEEIIHQPQMNTDEHRWFVIENEAFAMGAINQVRSAHLCSSVSICGSNALTGKRRAWKH